MRTLTGALTPSVDDATRREFIALLGAASLLSSCGSKTTPLNPLRVFTLEGRSDLAIVLVLRLPLIGSGSLVGTTVGPKFPAGATIINGGGDVPDLEIHGKPALRPHLIEPASVGAVIDSFLLTNPTQRVRRASTRRLLRSCAQWSYRTVGRPSAPRRGWTRPVW